MKSDGQVVISTALDNNGLEKGVLDVKGQLGGLQNVVKETGQAINSAISDGFSKSTLLAQAKLNELQRQLEAVSGSLKEAIDSDDDKAAEKYGRQQARIYDQIEAARERLLIAVQTDAKKQADAEERAAEKTRRAAEKTRKEIAKSVTPAKLLKKETLGISKGFGSAQKAVKRFGSRLVSIAASALIFNTISAALREMTSYMGSALKTNNEFSAELAKLKGALLTAFQPIYNFILPAITSLVRGLRIAIGHVAKLFSTLSGVTLESSAEAAKQLQKETEAMESLGSATKNTQKSLAGFDQIQKLGDSRNTSGGDNTAVNFDFGWDSNEVSQEVQSFVDNLTAQISEGDWYGAGNTVGETLMNGIKGINWNSVGSVIGKVLGSAVMFALGVVLRIDPLALLGSATSLLSGLMTGLSTAIQEADWSQIGKDIVDLVINSALTAIILTNPIAMFIALIFTPQGQELTSSASELVGSIVGALLGAVVGAGQRIGEIGAEIWNSIKGWVDENIDWESTPEDIIAGLWEGIKNALKNAGTWIYDNIWVPFRDGFKEAFDIHSPSHKMEDFGGDIIDGLCGGITGAISKVKEACVEIWEAIKEKFAGVGEWFEEKFSGAWEKVKEVFTSGSETFEGIQEGISETFKEIVNNLIDGINEIISVPFNKINSMLNTIRSIDILGVTPFKDLWSYNPLSVPQIPKLAQGAVLPPNKPFMAIVGDQKHGTNVEAPLSTIQEAVAVVMQDQVSAMMAGFNALLEENRMLRSVVEGIEVGDTVIGEAASRYNQKMAIVKGG